MKKRIRRKDLPNATDGLADMRRKRAFRRLFRTTDPAFIAVRFKPKKGKRKRWFPTPQLNLSRAQGFVWP